MTKAQIVSELYESPNINNFISRVDKDLQDDFRQELFLIICEKRDTEIIELYNKKHIYFYIARIMCNMLHSKTSPFFYKYRQIKKPIPVDQEDELLLSMEKECARAVEQLDWYEGGIIKLYAEKGSSRKVQAETGISHKSVMNTVNEARKKIKEIINQRMYA